MNNQTIQGFIYSYYHDIGTQAGKAAYDEMVQSIPAEKPFTVLAVQFKNPFQSGTTTKITIETTSIFDNQFNSDKYQLFDWCEKIPEHNKAIKHGYFLLKNPELDHIRKTTYKCGYCGKTSSKILRFCRQCLGSEYLKPENLSMLLLKPVNITLPVLPLNEKEQARLESLYKTAQHKTHIKRAKSILADKRARIKKSNADSKIEIAGFEWFLSRGINADNLIFYNRTRVFTFGWRTPVDDNLCNRLLDIISEFPYQYEIIAQRGKFTNKV